MKKHLLFLFAALLPLLASAQKVEIDGIWYNLTTETHTAEVTSGSDYSGSITIPATVTYDDVTYNVTSIGGSAFVGCRSLTAITIPEGVTSIGSNAFTWCSSLTSITIPEGVTSIGWEAFSGCSNLTTITIPENSQLTSIGDLAFRFCSSLTAITIPEGVTSIGSSAFIWCSSLTSITIPESVTSIGRSAFEGCSSLISITIPEGVTSIGEEAFLGCSSLTSITIPESLTSIGSSAFRDCSSLTSITIPESVTSIGWQAFYNCWSLTSITIPEGVTSIGGRTFSGCTSLTAINIPEGVTSIGWSAFSGCSGLTAITIPEGVTSIGESAFEDCSSLTAITCKAAIPPYIESSATFTSVDKSIPIYVPIGSIEAYKAASYWSEFTNIQPLSNEYTLKVSAAGYATLFLDYAAKIPDNVKAYIATSVEGDRLMMTRVTGVLPAETGVIVRAETGEYTFAKSDDIPANVEGNLLSGSSANKTITAESGYRYYVLAKKNDVVAMYHPQLTDGKFTNMANKAYLALKADDLGIFDEETNTEDEGGQLSNRLRFDFGGTTDIEMTTDKRSSLAGGKSNGGQTTDIYDLTGRRIENPTKGGIYIVNGKKVVVK